MLRNYASAFFYFGDHIGRIAVMEAFIPANVAIPDLSEDQRAGIIDTLEGAIPWLEGAEMALSIVSLRRAVEIVKNDGQVHEIGKAIAELNRRIKDELEATRLFLVERRKVSFYESPSLFGKEVTAKFPSANFDIEEAGKCLALDRGTACVMHLMRVIEAAVAAVAAGVGIPVDVARRLKAWEQLLKEINQKIKSNSAVKLPTWAASEGFFEDTLAFFYAVKDAWRNPGMHLERKYTLEEAERIYAAVKNLMEGLARHLDESGTFTP